MNLVEDIHLVLSFRLNPLLKLTISLLSSNSPMFGNFELMIETWEIVINMISLCEYISLILVITQLK